MSRELQRALAFSYSVSILSTSTDTCLLWCLGLLKEVANKRLLGGSALAWKSHLAS